MAMQIVRFEAENYKRLKAVTITPEGNVVFIGGRNAQGKTSVLDGIWAALAGRDASRATQQPIRDGQDSAFVKLDLGDYIVTRRWTKDDSGTLTVEAADGAKYASPQALLDKVVGARAFDPLAFTRQTAKEQVATLVAMVDLPFDPDALDRERKSVFDSRTEIGREVTKLEGQLAGYAPVDPSTPTEEVSGAEVLAKFEAARQHNTKLQRAGDAAAELQRHLDAIDRNADDLERKLKEARAERATVEARRQDAYADSQAAEPINLDGISAELAGLEETNAKIRAQAHRAAVAAELSDTKQRQASLTAKLNEIDKQKADALASVEFPDPDLSFDEGGVLYKGIPLSQASAAEQLRVSVALAMAANPTLRVLRILDGSLLDSDSLKLITELATEKEYQVWIEVVDESGRTGIVIEDGEVAA